MGVNQYLLDTHVFLWWLFNDSRLSYKARDIIKSGANELFLSAGSAWEISTKHRLGKLSEAGDVVEKLQIYMNRTRISSLDITIEDALLAGSFIHAHRDPFDRMIAAQAEQRSLAIVTGDKALQSLSDRCVW